MGQRKPPVPNALGGKPRAERVPDGLYPKSLYHHYNTAIKQYEYNASVNSEECVWEVSFLWS